MLPFTRGRLFFRELLQRSALELCVLGTVEYCSPGISEYSTWTCSAPGDFTRARRISLLSFAIDDVEWWDTETAAPANNMHGIVNNDLIVGDQE